MKSPKLSFLIAAHNEEKIIRKTLNNLLKLPYENYEVIIGLDGCTDNTEEIVKEFCKKSKKFNYYKLNLRQGKPAVINKIIKYTKGEIIIINDADWIFDFKNKNSLNKLVEVFNNPKVGGIAESFPITYGEKNLSLLGSGLMIQNYLWIDYIKNKGKKLDNNWISISKEHFPLLVNIFRKSLYRENKTLGDDFERCIDILARGKKVLATNNLNLPRMISVGESYNLKGLIKQKTRTAIARKQLGSKLRPMNVFDFTMFSIRKCLKMNIKELIGLCIINLIFIIGEIKARFKGNISTKQGWKMRLKR